MRRTAEMIILHVKSPFVLQDGAPAFVLPSSTWRSILSFAPTNRWQVLVHPARPRPPDVRASPPRWPFGAGARVVEPGRLRTAGSLGMETDRELPAGLFDGSRL